MVSFTALVGMAAIAAHSAPPALSSHGNSAIIEQATATAHIVSGARITHGRAPDDTAMITEARVRDSDGTFRSVKMIEFP